MTESKLVPKDCYYTWLKCKPVVCVDAIMVHQGKVYFFKRAFKDHIYGEWWVIGGQVFKDETRKDAIIRKCKEEVSVEVEVLEEVNTYDVILPQSEHHPDGLHAVATAYIVKPTSDDFQIKINEEYSEWKAFSEVPKGLYPYIQDIINDSKVFKDLLTS